MPSTPAHPSFARFRPQLAEHSAGLADLDARFVDRDDRHELVYVPFHHMNVDARLVVVGITPGPTQIRLAYESAGRDIRAGRPDAEVLRRTKAHAAFGGPMRRNLDRMLDHFGLPRLMGAKRAADLWSDDCAALECTSVVPHAAFGGGRMFAGRFAEVLASPVLRRCFEKEFVASLGRLRADAVFVALGPTPLDALDWCAARGAIRADRVLGAFAHPSAGAGSQVDVYLGARMPADLAERDPVRHRAVGLRAAHARMSGAVEALRLAVEAGDDGTEAATVKAIATVTEAEAVVVSPGPRRGPTSVSSPDRSGPGGPSGIDGVHAFVSRGREKGTLLRPHVHADGCHVVSPTRFERDYLRVPATEPIEPYLAKGLSLRMSARSIAPSLISAGSIRGWKP